MTSTIGKSKTLSSDERAEIFATVLTITKMMVELSAYVCGKIPEMNEHKDDVIKMASTCSFQAASILGYTDKEAIEITKSVYGMDLSGKDISELDIDDFLKGDA